MFLCAWWPNFFYHERQCYSKFIFKTERSSSEIWDCQWHKIFSAAPVFTALILLLLFQTIKIRQCCGFTFTNFLFFLTATNTIATNWVTFWDTRIIECFFYWLIWFSHDSLMQINPAHVHFTSRILWFQWWKTER